MRVLTVGNYTVDTVVLPGGRSAAHVFGGDCVYAAVGARIWGATVGTISVVGNDYPPEWLAALDAAGIASSGVRRLRIPHGLVAPMEYDEEGRRENERIPEADPAAIDRRSRLKLWGDFSPKVSDAEPFEGWADAVHLASMPLRRQDEFLRYFHGRVPLITVDLPWWPNLYRPGQLPRIDLASAVLLSTAEAKGHFGDRSTHETGQALLDRGARIVALKRGSEGSIVFQPGRSEGHEIPALPSDVVDPTGAGDAYCGGFVVGLHETSDAEIAGRYGTAAASFVIEGFTAQHALGVSRQDAEKRLARIPAAAPTGSSPA